jgi:RimJ/RimL family protein N-acetyltransferase
MLGYVFDRSDIVAPFVAALIPECRERGFGKCSTIGILRDDGELVGGLVYRNWHPEFGTIEMSGAALPGTNWFSRRTIQVMHDYPFYQVNCQMLIMTTLADNLIVQRILAAIGYAFHYIERLGGRDHDGIVATLTVERWETSRYNVNRHRPARTEHQIDEAA